MRSASGLAPGRSPGSARALVEFALAALLLHVVILLPGYPPNLGPDAFLRLPLELPLTLLALALATGRLFRFARATVIVLALVLILLRVANLGSQLAFGRSFNPLLEMHLVLDGWNLAAGSIGRTQALLALAVIALILLLVAAALWRGFGALTRLRRPRRRNLTLALGIASFATVGLMGVERVSGYEFGVQARLPHEVTGRIASMRRSMVDLARFERELPNDPLLATHAPDFAALAGRDVVVIFVESYGRTFLDAEPFTAKAERRLADVQARLAAAGLTVRSGWVRAPITGGRSWLSHATAMSGLRVTNQARFDRLTVSDRVSLNRLFADAGWHTVGVMPAVQLAWPEGAWYGFDDIRDAFGLGYAGEPFGWVTMPDQFVLSAFENEIRRPIDQAVMAEIALVSSHAPWTPLPRVVPWDAIGNGSIFDGGHRYGVSAGEVWRDPELVERHYTESLDYSLDVLAGYLERYAGSGLFVILGDHQPASVIGGDPQSFDVPIHVVAADPDLLARLPVAQFTTGMTPAPELPALPMESLRAGLATWYAAPPDGDPDTPTIADSP